MIKEDDTQGIHLTEDEDEEEEGTDVDIAHVLLDHQEDIVLLQEEMMKTKGIGEDRGLVPVTDRGLIPMTGRGLVPMTVHVKDTIVAGEAPLVQMTITMEGDMILMTIAICLQLGKGQRKRKSLKRNTKNIIGVRNTKRKKIVLMKTRDCVTSSELTLLQALYNNNK